ncbi:hypothetical protein DICVIV_12767 [Dictyocaulus viviparus]|uniref:aECM cysteine-cradle domain-containing protein n=1 Tax=Dictyocaulus viviparus TaxID=29172 RepID=A0A0D8X9M6_DICVI|nr:hypothetical protein DICVIV_12767 [Dictyocaulus viviparus]
MRMNIFGFCLSTVIIYSINASSLLSKTINADGSREFRIAKQIKHNTCLCQCRCVPENTDLFGGRHGKAETLAESVEIDDHAVREEQNQKASMVEELTVFTKETDWLQTTINATTTPFTSTPSFTSVPPKIPESDHSNLEEISITGSPTASTLSYDIISSSMAVSSPEASITLAETQANLDGLTLADIVSTSTVSNTSFQQTTTGTVKSILNASQTSTIDSMRSLTPEVRDSIDAAPNIAKEDEQNVPLVFPSFLTTSVTQSTDKQRQGRNRNADSTDIAAESGVLETKVESTKSKETTELTSSMARSVEETTTVSKEAASSTFPAKTSAESHMEKEGIIDTLESSRSTNDGSTTSKLEMEDITPVTEASMASNSDLSIDPSIGTTDTENEVQTTLKISKSTAEDYIELSTLRSTSLPIKQQTTDASVQPISTSNTKLAEEIVTKTTSDEYTVSFNSDVPTETILQLTSISTTPITSKIYTSSSSSSNSVSNDVIEKDQQKSDVLIEVPFNSTDHTTSSKTTTKRITEVTPLANNSAPSTVVMKKLELLPSHRDLPERWKSLIVRLKKKLEELKAQKMLMNVTFTVPLPNEDQQSAKLSQTSTPTAFSGSSIRLISSEMNNINQERALNNSRTRIVESSSKRVTFPPLPSTTSRTDSSSISSDISTVFQTTSTVNSIFSEQVTHLMSNNSEQPSKDIITGESNDHKNVESFSSTITATKASTSIPEITGDQKIFGQGFTSTTKETAEIDSLLVKNSELRGHATSHLVKVESSMKSIILNEDGGVTEATISPKTSSSEAVTTEKNQKSENEQELFSSTLFGKNLTDDLTTRSPFDSNIFSTKETDNNKSNELQFSQDEPSTKKSVVVETATTNEIVQLTSPKVSMEVALDNQQQLESSIIPKLLNSSTSIQSTTINPRKTLKSTTSNRDRDVESIGGFVVSRDATSSEEAEISNNARQSLKEASTTTSTSVKQNNPVPFATKEPVDGINFHSSIIKVIMREKPQLTTVTVTEAVDTDGYFTTYGDDYEKRIREERIRYEQEKQSREKQQLHETKLENNDRTLQEELKSRSEQLQQRMEKLKIEEAKRLQLLEEQQRIEEERLRKLAIENEERKFAELASTTLPEEENVTKQLFNYRLRPAQCAAINKFTRVFHITDPSVWISKNCQLAKRYFPQASCPQIQSLLESCFVFM